jgi:hypothetical protein
MLPYGMSLPGIQVLSCWLFRALGFQSTACVPSCGSTNIFDVHVAFPALFCVPVGRGEGPEEHTFTLQYVAFRAASVCRVEYGSYTVISVTAGTCGRRIPAEVSLARAEVPDGSRGMLTLKLSTDAV